MMIKELSQYLVKNGYIDRQLETKECKMLFRISMQIVDAVLILDATGNFPVSPESLQFASASLKQMVRGELHLLTLVITRDGWLAHQLGQECPFCWALDPDRRQLMIEENQVQEFYGLRGLLDTFLRGEADAERPSSEKRSVESPAAGRSFGKQWRSAVLSHPLVTYGILAANVIVFLVCTLTDNMLYNGGVLFGPYVLERGEYYRLITSMFLHGGVEHLFSNMLVLVALGEMMEDYYGHIRYGILYLAAGVGGGCVSIWYADYSGNMHGSVGASGAIFGLIGAVLFLVIVNRGFFRNISITRILFAIGYSIYAGVRSANVDNAAHVGGMIAGFMIAGILELTVRKGRR